MPSNPMCVEGTPVEHYPELGLWVKREDLCCPSGPHFSKTRGVYAHVKARPEKVIGVLDTHHSQGGWAVARACQLLGKQCINFYPVRKSERGEGMKPQQEAAMKLGATTVPLQAGRSAVLYHGAKARLLTEWSAAAGAYMMPNALKLPEMITETVAEVRRTNVPASATGWFPIIVSASSGTIAAGVILGFHQMYPHTPFKFIVHQGYDRPAHRILSYMAKMIGWDERTMPLVAELVNEGYAYGDESKGKAVPPFPSNRFYDLKAFHWWLREGRAKYGEALLWNIG